MKAEIYLPSVALFPDDLRSRVEMLKPAREAGFKTGLMLLIRGPQDLETEAVEKQLANLNQLTSREEPYIFVMHSNMPLSGPKRFNFLNNPDWSEEYVRKSIDFQASIPERFIPPSGRMVTFHLNTLVRPKDWVNDYHYWEVIFVKVLLRIKRLIEYASTKKTALALETTPIPEFGDIPRDRKHQLANGTYWSDLGNPWPLFPWNSEISKLREIGLHMKIDFSHSFIGMNSLREVARLASIGK